MFYFFPVNWHRVKKQQTKSAISSPDRETADLVCCFLEANKTCGFSIGQKNGLQIITAIKTRLNLVSKTSYKEASSFYTMNTTSKSGVQNVIHFMTEASAKLKGYKRMQYLKWLEEVRLS